MVIPRNLIPWSLQERLNDLYEFRFDCHTWSLAQFSDAVPGRRALCFSSVCLRSSVQVCAKHGRASQWQILAGRRGSERDEGALSGRALL